MNKTIPIVRCYNTSAINKLCTLFVHLAALDGELYVTFQYENSGRYEPNKMDIYLTISCNVMVYLPRIWTAVCIYSLSKKQRAMEFCSMM